jgi:serine/threonine-protein kinase
LAELSTANVRDAPDRYELLGEIAASGKATVHLARLREPCGAARPVAVKRLLRRFAGDPEAVAMFREESRLAARVIHPNVVRTLEAAADDAEPVLVMEYVPGESLSRLVRLARDAGRRVPAPYVVAIVCQALDGLHAVHEATSETGAPLLIVHRDVSPQNIQCGIDGVARLLDFGIAEATCRPLPGGERLRRADRIEGTIEGKIAYASPEQLVRAPLDRRADVYSASVILWEALTGERLFAADDVPSLVSAILHAHVRAPSSAAAGLPTSLDAIVLRGLERDASRRWRSAREMAEALRAAIAPAPAAELGAWVQRTAGHALASRMELLARAEDRM